MTTDNDRSGFLAGLTDAQRDLYRDTNKASAATRQEFWKTLADADAPAEDKWQVAEAMGYSNVADREFAEAAGRDPHRGKVDMNSLDRGDRFIGPDEKTRYEVTTPASEHERGWTEVRNLSMTDEEAADRVVEAGQDPRDGFFAYSYPTYVQPDTAAQQEQAQQEQAQQVDADDDVMEA